MPIPDCGWFTDVGVYEIASISKRAESFLAEPPAIFCLILAVLLLILLQLMQPMCELASILVWTASVLYKFLAELRFFLGGQRGRVALSRRLLGGQRVAGLLVEDESRREGGVFG